MAPTKLLEEMNLEYDSSYFHFPSEVFPIDIGLLVLIIL